MKKILISAVLICILFTASSSFGKPEFSVNIYKPDQVYPGTTLFAQNSGPGKAKIVEVDMQGNIVWQYKVPVQFFKGKLTPKNIVMDVEKLSNGDVLFNIQEVGFFHVNPKGEIIFEFYDSGCSHDIDRLGSGNYLYVRGWASKGKDHVVEIDPKGKSVWTWNGMDEFNKPPFAKIYNQGWIHVNAATRLPNGNTLISLRNFNMIVEVDSTGHMVWERKLGGKKKNAKAHPHDPEQQPDGNIIVALTGADKVIEFSRDGGPPVWEFAYKKGPSPHHIRDINILPNNNRLMVMANKILEITPAREIVWEMQIKSINPRSKNKNLFLFKAQRIGLDSAKGARN